MKLKLFFQGILFISIISILIAFYYVFLQNKNEKNLISKEDDLILDNEVSNELINIEYNSIDAEGNTFYINAEKAIIEFKDQSGIDNQSEVSLNGVISVINLKEKGIINIYSDYAIYNKLNHDTLFYDNVKVEYLGNSISADNLDLIFSKKISRIYNNVVYKNNKLNLNTDKAIIDMVSGDIKLEMNEKNKKVKLISKYEYIN
tara:strand:- start:184 stop:792 length:609 start_codon:yes stop_codon:yes gene_type:complete